MKIDIFESHYKNGHKLYENGYLWKLIENWSKEPEILWIWFTCQNYFRTKKKFQTLDESRQFNSCKLMKMHAKLKRHFPKQAVQRNSWQGEQKTEFIVKSVIIIYSIMHAYF